MSKKYPIYKSHKGDICDKFDELSVKEEGCTCHKNTFSTCAYCKDLPDRRRAREKREREKDRDRMKAYERALASQDFHSSMEKLSEAMASGSKSKFTISYGNNGKKNKKSKHDKGYETNASLGGGYAGVEGKGAVSRKQKDDCDYDSGEDSEFNFKIKYDGLKKKKKKKKKKESSSSSSD